MGILPTSPYAVTNWLILVVGAVLFACVAMRCKTITTTKDDFANKWRYTTITLAVLGLFFIACIKAGQEVAEASDTVSCDVEPDRQSFPMNYLSMSGKKDGKYCEDREGAYLAGFYGVKALCYLSVIFLTYNALTVFPGFREQYFRRTNNKKPNAMGIFLTIGASSVIFGFLDNFGMKLGTDALENGLFLKMGKALVGTGTALDNDAALKAGAEAFNEITESDAISTGDLKAPFQPEKNSGEYSVLDVVFQKDQKNTTLREEVYVKAQKTNIDTLSKWNEKVEKMTKIVDYLQSGKTGEAQDMARALKGGLKGPDFESESAKDCIKTLNSVMQAKEFVKIKNHCRNVPVTRITGKITGKDMNFAIDDSQKQAFVADSIKRYATIKDSSSMLGNTFSDFIGAMLGAGVAKLFEYLTGYIDDDDSFAGRVLQNPVMQVLLNALFVALGCLIPVMMHFDSELSGTHKTPSAFPKRLWKGIVFFLVIAIILAGMAGVTSRSEEEQVEDTSSQSLDTAVAVIVTVLFTALLAFFVKKMIIGKFTAEE